MPRLVLLSSIPSSNGFTGVVLGPMTVERSHEDVMTTMQRTQGLAAIAAQPTFREIDGVQIRFVESERRTADALLLSPWPESVFAYEATWSRLAENTHLVA